MNDPPKMVHCSTTGDVGYIDTNGELYITGRIKRIIITKDLNGIATKLFPDRVERVISRCEGVKECCVIEKADEERINVPIAFICIYENGDSVDSIKGDIIGKCKKDLPEYMIPEQIIVIDEMPRTSRGKTDYRVLDEKFIKGEF